MTTDELLEENNKLRKQLLSAFITVENTREWYRNQIVAYHENMLARDKKLFKYVDKVLGDQNRELIDTRDFAIQQLNNLNQAAEKAGKIKLVYTAEDRKVG